ncbi:hypothetical protein C5S32_07535 [ANME-1 cluster archaeon GoMg1]|nr:hypothetical protein [ANME-1 cluster archaeon GoMg1]
MSTKLRIRIKKLIDPELDLKLDYGELVRLSILIRFKTESGWSKLYEAIIDTGAHTSVIPRYIWEGIYAEEKANHFVQGIVPKEECSLPVKVSIISGVLFDDELDHTNEVEFYAFCAIDDRVPLILGFKDLLETFAIHFDIKSGVAYLEE